MNLVQRTRTFFDDVKKELQRSSWPSRDEVQGTTLVVIVAVLVVSVYLGAIDLVLAFVQQQLLFRFLGN